MVNIHIDKNGKQLLVRENLISLDFPSFMNRLMLMLCYGTMQYIEQYTRVVQYFDLNYNKLQWMM